MVSSLSNWCCSLLQCSSCTYDHYSCYCHFFIRGHIIWRFCILIYSIRYWRTAFSWICPYARSLNFTNIQIFCLHHLIILQSGSFFNCPISYNVHGLCFTKTSIICMSMPMLVSFVFFPFPFSFCWYNTEFYTFLILFILCGHCYLVKFLINAILLTPMYSCQINYYLVAYHLSLICLRLLLNLHKALFKPFSLLLSTVVFVNSL